MRTVAKQQDYSCAISLIADSYIVEIIVKDSQGLTLLMHCDCPFIQRNVFNVYIFLKTRVQDVRSFATQLHTSDSLGTL